MVEEGIIGGGRPEGGTGRATRGIVSLRAAGAASAKWDLEAVPGRYKLSGMWVCD